MNIFLYKSFYIFLFFPLKINSCKWNYWVKDIFRFFNMCCQNIFQKSWAQCTVPLVVLETTPSLPLTNLKLPSDRLKNSISFSSAFLRLLFRIKMFLICLLVICISLRTRSCSLSVRLFLLFFSSNKLFENLLRWSHISVTSAPPAGQKMTTTIKT